MFNRILGIHNKQSHTIRHDIASTSNSQQESELRNNEIPGPNNVNVNNESTSHNNLQHRDTFNTANGNNGNLLVEDTRHGSNSMLAGSFNIFFRKRISQTQMNHALNIWENNINRNENRSTAKDRILECFQQRDTVLSLVNLNLKSLPEEIGNLTWLSELNLSSNQLTEVPNSLGNLTRLSKLHLNNNQLTELPGFIGNLTGLRTLKLGNNQLTELPGFIGSLIGLRWLDLSSNRLIALPDFISNLNGLHTLNLENNQLAALPDSLSNLSGLRSLKLDNNQLTVLPDFIRNLTGLRWLGLSNNQLIALPDFIGNLTELRALCLDNNQLTSLPQSIFRLPQATRINLNRNPLSQQTMVALTQRADGPQISFSIIEAPSAQTHRSRSFEDAIRHYCSGISPERLQNLRGTENADCFGQLINRLDGTAGYSATAEASLPGFTDRVAAVIRTLAEVDSAELRANCYLQAQQGLETCSDRVTITFSDIEIACKSHRILQAGGGHDQMMHLLRGVFRLSTLDAFARSDIATRRGVDEIEVILAYRVGLKNELELPCETVAMRYNAISGVNRAALDRAKAHVLTIERADNSAALVNFAIEQPFWNTYLEKNQRFQKHKQDIEAVFQRSSEELEERAQTISGKEYVQEYNTLAANRDAMLREIQREYTREIFRS